MIGFKQYFQESTNKWPKHLGCFDVTGLIARQIPSNILTLPGSTFVKKSYKSTPWEIDSLVTWKWNVRHYGKIEQIIRDTENPTNNYKQYIVTEIPEKRVLILNKIRDTEDQHTTLGLTDI